MKNNYLHKCIRKSLELIANPLDYYLQDAVGEGITDEKVYMAYFLTGYFGGWERSCELAVVSPGCLVMAYYLEKYLDIAYELIPGLTAYSDSLQKRKEVS